MKYLVACNKYSMRFTEIAPTKPKTPEQNRVQALQQRVEHDRDALQAERDRQRSQRDALRKRKLNLPSV